ncbi:a-factor receptor [Clarireedia jacksonii]
MNIPTTIPPDLPAVSYRPSANAILLPLFSLLISLLLITPFQLLLRVQNIPTTSLIVTIWVSLLFITLNSLIWPTEDLSHRFSGHGLCDTEVLLRQALYTTMASTTCCITRFLASALDTDNACLYESRAMKRRRVWKDCLFCFAVPVCQVGLHYLVQLNRYTVLTVYGCMDSMDPSWVSLVIFHVWPPIFALLNFYYAVLVIRRLHQHRSNLSSTLSRSSSSASLSPRRFLKLFLMSLTLLLIYFPILIYYFYLNISYPFHAYSFSTIHDPLYWSVIVFWQTADAPEGMQYDAWCWVAMGFLVCCFWGWNEEAGELWRGWAVKLGLGKCWPRLKLSAKERREGDGSRSRSGRAGKGSGGSWVDSLDVVGRTLNYFESREVARKASFATTTTLDGGGITQTPTRTHTRSNSREPSSTRKPPLSNHDHDQEDKHESSFSSTTSTFTHTTSLPQNNLDTITPLPASASASTIPYPPPPTTHTHSHPTPLFSSFRTHLNPLPLAALFSSSSSSSSPTSPSAVKPLRHEQEREERNPHSTSHQYSTTTISAQGKGKGKGRSSLLSDDDGDDDGMDTALDMEGLKPGTRAYRERERREMVKTREMEKEKMKMEKRYSGGDTQGEEKGKVKRVEMSDANGGAGGKERLRIEQEVIFGVE